MPSDDDDSAGLDEEEEEDSDEDYTSISEGSDSGREITALLSCHSPLTHPSFFSLYRYLSSLHLFSDHCVYPLFVLAEFEEEEEEEVESDEESGKDWDELEEEAAKG